MSDRWKRIGELFHEAVQKPSAEREEYLAQACAGDRELEAELRTLLRHHDRAGDFLHETGGPIRPAAAPPAQVGVWKVLEPLGEGGMGAVYRVERQDGEFRQVGALKLIRTELVDDAMIVLFRRERQILAGLNHPGIAKLLDGGTTAEGVPWLVMEYIEGRHLHVWCREKALTLRQRLELFVRTCDAVSYAHQRLVLHRDLKPDNILVTADGTPRVLDFGVGKDLGEALSLDPAEPRTLTPLTPDYAAPEQVRGEPATIASDVYALGVILYECISGARAYPVSATPHERTNAVLTVDPVRPSTAVRGGSRVAPSRFGAPSDSGDALRKGLSGDLDLIALKALQKDAARRYASVEQFAADVRAYLEARPVQARPDHWSYRASRFIRRNRGAVAFGAIAVTSLVGGLVVALWQGSVAHRERRAAERRFDEVQSLAHSLLFEVHDAIAPLPGATQARELIVTRATEYLDRLAADAGRDSALRLDLADAYDRLGAIQGQVWQANVGRPQDAHASLLKARRIRDALYADYPDDERNLYGLLQIYGRLGNWAKEHRQYDEALVFYKQSLFYNQRLFGRHPTEPRYAGTVERRLANVGMGYVELDSVGTGLEYWRRAIAGFRGWVAAEPENLAHRRGLAQCLSGYAEGLMRMPDMTDSAATYFHEALRQFSELSRAHPDDLESLLRVGNEHFLLAELAEYRQARPESALVHLEAMRGPVDRLAAEDPADQNSAFASMATRAFEGLVLAQLGRLDQAEAFAHPAFARFEGWLRTDSTDRRMNQGAADASDALGVVALARAKRAGPGSATAAQEADRWFVRSRAALARANSAGQSGLFFQEQANALDRARAELATARKSGLAGR